MAGGRRQGGGGQGSGPARACGNVVAVPPTPPAPSEKGRRTSAHYSLLAFGLNAAALIVLFANLLTGNTWWQIAVPIALGGLLLGGLSALQSRRLRSKERRNGL